MIKKMLTMLILISPMSYSSEYTFEITGYKENVDLNNDFSLEKNKLFHYKGTIKDDGSLNKYQLNNSKEGKDSNGIVGFQLSYSLKMEQEGLSIKNSLIFSYFDILDSEKLIKQISKAYDDYIDIGETYKKKFKDINILVTYKVTN